MEAGFKEVNLQPLCDLTLASEHLSGTVEYVSIDGITSFKEDEEYSYDVPITVYYHSIKQVSPPILSYIAKGDDYNSIKQLFESAGFVNVSVTPIDDLVLGLFKKDGAVESIAINGVTKYSTEDTYRPDAQVIISYHTFTQ